MRLHNHRNIIGTITDRDRGVLRESPLDPLNRHRLLFWRNSAANNDFTLATELYELFLQFRMCLHLAE